MASSVPGSARKKIIVQSRYRSMSVSKKRVPASSPQRDTVPSFNISDSVASSIPSRKTNYSLSLKTHSKHSPFLSDEELSKLSNQTIWKFLVLKSKRALENQEFTENSLRNSIAEKRGSDTWFKKWLTNQKAIDEEIEISKDLIASLAGDDGVISLLRRFHDHQLIPVSNRLPVDGISIGDDLLDNLKNTVDAHDQVQACLQRQVDGLTRLSNQVSEVAEVVKTSTAWATNRDEVLPKLSEASRLLLHLASLQAHRREIELIEKLDSIFQ